MRILVVEDDPTLAEFVAKGLQEAGYVVDIAEDGRRGLDLAAANRPDLAVVDVMLPALDGLGLIEALRHRGLRFPVLILSAKRSIDDRVKGLEVGGDDYLTKPFAFAELLARVQALLRRSSSASSEPTRLQVADLEIDLLARRVTRGGQPIDLRPREFALLEYLARQAGRVVSKTMIQSRIWNYSFDPRTNVVDVLVHRLRERIDHDFSPKLLHTRRGMGYVLGVEPGGD
ncbi:MAG TPA: response regulator [Vicinamibacterales bacterium]|jgi:two-component system OmpR family response regulator|nr:response regulator [Vicinamibacterales bacterium]